MKRSSIPPGAEEEQTKGALQGQKLSARLLEPPVEKPGLLRLYAQDGTFRGFSNGMN